MLKKLTKHGNSLALIIDKPILRLLEINEKTKLQISIEEDTLIIRKFIKKDKKKDKDESDNIY